MSKDFSHRGIAIALQHDGSFGATINGQWVKVASLKSMQKKIDKAEDDKFPVTPCLINVSYYDGKLKFTEGAIVGVKVARKKWGRTLHQFVVDFGKGASTTIPHKVIADTPKNRAAMQALTELIAEQERLKDSMREAREKAENKVVYLVAEGFGQQAAK